MLPEPLTVDSLAFELPSCHIAWPGTLAACCVCSDFVAVFTVHEVMTTGVHILVKMQLSVVSVCVNSAQGRGVGTLGMAPQKPSGGPPHVLCPQLSREPGGE